MSTFLARRLLAVIPTILLVTFGIYLLISLVPGDPAVQLAGGTNATHEQIEQVREELHLNDPLLSQYWRWLNHAARGDLGDSLFSHTSVAQEIADRLPVTASVVGLGVLLGVIFGATFGILAGMFPASRTDRSAMLTSSLGLAIPNFWLAMLLVLFFAINRSWFPATGYTKFGTDPWEWLRSITLPAFALSIPLSAVLARQIRSSLSGTMQENYVKTAWAKGASVRTVVGKHAMKNASIPAITIVGFALATLLGASVLIEQIFALPGIGSYVLTGIQNNDMPVIQGVALVFVLANVVMGLLVDLAYMVVNPKVRVRVIEPGELETSLLHDAPASVDDAHDLTPAEPGPTRRALRLFGHNVPGMIALGVILFFIAVALLASVLAPHGQEELLGKPFQGPSGKYWLGTDDIGRDMLSRLIYGTQVSMQAAFQTVGLALVFAIPLGLAAGYLAGTFDLVVMRVMDALISFPSLVLALVIAAVLGPSLENASIAIAITLIPSIVRLIRGEALGIAQETFVEASRSMGTKRHTIMRKHILPGVLATLIVQVTLLLGVALIAEAALSFLGLGAQPPQASWGSMLQRGFAVINSHPYLMVPPGVAIAIAVFAFNAFGDALRDALGLGTTPAQAGMKRGKLGITSVVEITPPSAPSPSGDAAASAPPDAAAPMLTVHGLEVEFATTRGRVTVVEDVSFEVGRGEVVGLVGESGCGKSVTSTAIMRLLPTPPARIVGGSVRLDGRELLDLSVKDLRTTRGSEIAMVFQDPMSSLNPAFTIGNQLVEAVRLHHDVKKSVARARALELLQLVGIPDPQSRIDEYPHRLSGGMRQRVVIAMALANEPKLLIADEPTTALDVTVQAQILELLSRLRDELGMSVLFVTHDLGVVAEMCDRVVVMYAGQVVEEAPVEAIFSDAEHPYTRALLSSIPQSSDRLDRLVSIPGRVPVPGTWPKGCRFAPRCPFVAPECSDPVALLPVGDDHRARCIRTDVVVASGR